MMEPEPEPPAPSGGAVVEDGEEAPEGLSTAEHPQMLGQRAAAAFDAAELLARGGDGGGNSDVQPADMDDDEAVAKYKECVSLYTDALQYLPPEPGDPDLSSAERSKYFSCRAEARMQLLQFGAAVRDCDAAIALSPTSAMQAAAEQQKRRAASMATQVVQRAEDTAKNTMTSAAETIKQNKDLAKELADLDPETAKGGLKSMTLMAAVTKLKNRGNEAFRMHQWASAAEDYRAGIVVIRLAQQEARRERDAEREAHLALDGDDYVSEMVETVEVKEAWPGEALNLRNLYGNLAAALLGLVRCFCQSWRNDCVCSSESMNCDAAGLSCAARL